MEESKKRWGQIGEYCARMTAELQVAQNSRDNYMQQLRILTSKEFNQIEATFTTQDNQRLSVAIPGDSAAFQAAVKSTVVQFLQKEIERYDKLLASHDHNSGVLLSLIRGEQPGDSDDGNMPKQSTDPGPVPVSPPVAPAPAERVDQDERELVEA